MNTRAHTIGAGRGVAAGMVFLAMLLAAFSLWTAIPLTWVYIASKVSHTQFPSGGPYLVVIAGILISVTIVAWLIGRLNDLYIRITGTNRLHSIRATWLRSMRDSSSASPVTVVEAVMMCSVMLAAIALTVWFFLLSGSPIPNQ